MSGKDAVSSQEMEDRIQQLINGAPGTLDTLKELADVLGDPNNIATDVITKLNLASSKTELLSVSEHINLNDIETKHYKDLSITSSKIGPQAVTTSKIMERSIGDKQIALTSINATHLATDSIITSKIQNLAITTSKINTGAVTTMKIGDAQVVTQKLADSSVTAAKIQNLAVTRGKIFDHAVSSLQIENNSITYAKMHENSVGTENIIDGNITQEKLAVSSVNTLHIINNNITNAKMAHNSIASYNIIDSNVTTEKLENSAVTTSKILNSAVTTSKIANLNVTTAKIGYNAVTNDQIMARTIQANRLVEKTITHNELSDDSVRTNHILNSSITSDKLANNTIVEIDLSNNAVTTSKIKDLNVTTDKLANNSITTEKILNRNITSEKIAMNSITEFELNTNAVHFEHIKDSNVLTNAIANKNITYAKIQNVPSNSLLVRNSNDSGTLTDFRVNNKQILIGNGMGFNAKELSGDVVMENNGEVLIKTNAITRDKIHDREVVTEKIANRAVTSNEIEIKTILGGAVGNIAFDTIHAENIKPGEIKNSHLESNSVQTLQIADRNITTEKLANNAVTNNELRDNSVGTTNIISLNVTAEKLSAGSVETGKIKNLAVTNTKLSENSVSTGKIIDNSVLLSKIQQVSGNSMLARDEDSTGVLVEKTVGNKEFLVGSGNGFNSVALSNDVTMENDGSVTISDNAVKTNNINAASVTQAKMANNSVGTNQLIQNSVTGGNDGKIALDTIDHTNITNNAIKTGHITDEAVLTNKIKDSQVIMTKLSNAIQNKLNSFNQGTGATPANLDQIAVNKTNIETNESAIHTLTNGAPTLLQTLDDIADAIGNDDNFSITITNQLANRMQKGTLDDLTSHVTENIYGEKRFAQAIVADITGESATTKKLAVRPDTGLPVKIAGKDFDGTESIQITAADITGLTPGSNHIIEVSERNKLSAIEDGSQKTNFTNMVSAGGVMTTTNQTISGIKTFADNIVAPQGLTGDLTGDVLTADQSNITKVGSLISLNVTNNITADSDLIISGNIEAKTGDLDTVNINTSGDITAVGTIEANRFKATPLNEGVDVGGFFTGDLIGNVTGNADTATRFAKSDLTIAGVPFDGTTSINLNGVNRLGNQDTTGNAATASIFKDPINIGDVSFDGSVDIVPKTIQIISNDTSNANKNIIFTTGGGNQQSMMNNALLYNPVQEKLSVPNISGNLLGNVAGLLTGKVIANDSSTIIDSSIKQGNFNSLNLNGNTVFGGNAITGGIGSVITAASLVGSIATPTQSNITELGILNGIEMGGDIILNNNRIVGGIDSILSVGTINGFLSGTADSALKLAGTITIAGKQMEFSNAGNAVITVEDLATGGVLKITGDTTQTVTGTKIFHTLKLGDTLDGNEQNISNVNTVSAAAFNGTIVQQAQPQITSVGILNGLTMSDDIEMSSKNIINANAISATTFSGELAGNSATVTNGAYITANNQFGGTNKFVQKLIIGNGIEFQGGDLKLQNSNLDTEGNITCDTITASGLFQGTATFVQDGVYASTTQTITGNKTFSGNNTFTKMLDAQGGINGSASRVTDGVYASEGNTFTGTGNEFLNALSCPSGIQGNASSATILRDTRQIGSSFGNLGTPATGGFIGGRKQAFNGSQDITLTPQHVGLSSVSTAIEDTTVISAVERLQIQTNTEDIATNVARIEEVVGSAPEALDTLQELATYLTGAGDGADGVAGGLVASLSAKVNNTGDETINGLKTFADGIVVPVGKEITGVVAVAGSLSSGRKIGNSFNWGSKRDLDNETGELIDLTPGNVGLFTNSLNQEDMKIITAGERNKLEALLPDGGVNVDRLSGINVVFTTLGTQEEPQTFGADINVTDGSLDSNWGYVQFNRLTKIPGGISGGPVTIQSHELECGPITSTHGIICAKADDGTDIGLQTTGIIETSMATGTGLKIANNAEIQGTLSINNAFTVDVDKFVVANASGNVSTAGTITAAGAVTMGGDLTVGSDAVDAFGDLVTPTQTNLNGSLYVNGDIVIAPSTANVTKNFEINSALLLKESLELADDCDSVFKGDVTIGQIANSKATKMFGTLEVTQNVTVDSNVLVGGGMIIDGSVSIKDTVNFTGEMNGGATFNIDEGYTTNIGGNTNISGDVIVVNKSFTINNGLGVPVDQFKVTKEGDITGNNLTVVHDLAIGGNSALTGTLDVTAKITGADDLAILGNSALTGTLNVTEKITGADDLAILGNSALTGTLDVTEKITGADDLAILGNSALTGTLNVTEKITGADDLQIDGDSALTGTLDVTGMITGDITGDLTGQVLTFKQNVIAELGSLTSAGTTGIDTTFRGPVDATAEGFKGDLVGDVTGDITGDLTGQILTAKQDTIATLDVLTAIGTTGIKTVFKGPIEGKEGIEVDLTGQILTAKQDTIATLDVLTSVGTAGIDTVFKGPVNATDQGFKGDLTGQILTAKQDTIATLDVLTSIGSTAVDTVFKGPIHATEGIRGNVVGNLTLVDEPALDKHATTKKYVDDEITKLTGTEGLDEALDTLKEIGDYLTDNGVADGVVQQLSTKQPNLTAGHGITILNVANDDGDNVLTIKSTGAVDTEGAIYFPGVHTGDDKVNKIYKDADSGNLEFNDGPIKGRLNTVNPTMLKDPYFAILDNHVIDVGLKIALTDVISAIADTIPESFDIGPAMLRITSSGVLTGGYSDDATIPIEFAWSEILADDLELDDLVLTNCTLTNLTKNATIHRLYTATLTPTTEGVVSVALLDGAIVDANGNATTQQIPFTYTYDVTSPTTILTIASSNNNKAVAKLDNTVTLTITSDETITKPTVVMKLSNVAIDPGYITVSATNGITEGVNGNELTHSDVWTASFNVGLTLLLSNVDWVDGDMTFSVIATDLAGNQADANTTITEADDVSSMTILRSRPVITVTDMLVVNNDPSDAGSKFIERLATYVPDFTAANSVGDSITADVNEVSSNLNTALGNSTPYEIVYTVTDAAGNVSLDTTVQLTVQDTTPPLVALNNSGDEILAVVSNNALDADDATLAIEGDTIKISFTSNEELEASDSNSGIETNVTFSIGGGAAKPAIDLVQKTGSTSKLEWEAIYTVTNSDNGVVKYVIKMTDIYGNITTTASANSNVVVDTVAPTVTDNSLTIVSNNPDTSLAKTGEIVTISLVASEELHGAVGKNTVSYKILQSDGQAGQVIDEHADIELIKAVDSNTYSAAFMVAANDSGNAAFDENYQYSLKLTDLAGNESVIDYADSGISVDRIAPIVTGNLALAATRGTGNDAAIVTKAKAGDVISVSFDASEELHGTASNNTVIFTLGVKDIIVELTKAVDSNTYSGNYTILLTEAGDLSYIIKMTDLAGNVTTTNKVDLDINVNNTAPVLTQTTAITAMSNNQTPVYVFQSDKAGSVSVSTGSLSSGEVIAVDGINANHTIAFNTIAEGIHSSTGSKIAVSVTDAHGNVSDSLNIPEFKIDLTVPAVSGNVTITATRGTGDDADNTITKAKAGDVIDMTFTASESLSDTASDNTVTFTFGTTAINGINLTLVNSAVHLYSATHTLTADHNGAVKYVIKMTDLAGNSTDTDSVTSSIIANNTPPTLTQVTAIATPRNNQTPSYVFQSDKAGTVAVSSGTLTAGANIVANADHTLVFDTIVAGTHSSTNSEITVNVTDIHGNVSSALIIPEFVIDLTPPSVTLGTDPGYVFKPYWNIETPQIKIRSSKSGIVELKDSNGDVIADGITAPPANDDGNIPIAENGDGTTFTFNAVEAAYASGDFKIAITDAAGNETVFDFPEFTTDLTNPILKPESTPVITAYRVVGGLNVNKTFLKEGDKITIVIETSEELHRTADNNRMIFNAKGSDDPDDDVERNLSTAANHDVENNVYEYTATYTVANGDSGIPKYKIKLTDLAENTITDAAFIDIAALDISTVSPIISTKADYTTVAGHEAIWSINSNTDGDVLLTGGLVIDGDLIHPWTEAEQYITFRMKARLQNGNIIDLPDNTYSANSFFAGLTDKYGNSQVSQIAIPEFIIDTTAPTVTISTHPAVLSNTPSVSFSLNEDAIKYEIIDENDVVLISSSENIVGGTNTTVDLQGLPSAIYSNVKIKVTDIANNTGEVTINDFIHDKNAPLIPTASVGPPADDGVTIIATRGDDDTALVNIAKNDEINLTFTADEALSATASNNTVTFTFGAEQLAPINLTLSEDEDADTHTYTLVYTVLSNNNGPLSYVLKLTDVLGNTVTANSVTTDLISSNIPPIVTSATIVSNNTENTKLATIDDEIALTIVVDQLIKKPVVIIAGDTVPPANVVIGDDQANWTATLTVDADTDEGDAAISITFENLAGIPADAHTTLDVDADEVSVDVTSPDTNDDVTITATRGTGDDATTVTKAKAGDVIDISFTTTEVLHATADNNTVTFKFGTTANAAIDLIKAADSNTYSAQYTLLDTDNDLLSYVIKMTDLPGNVTTTTSVDSIIIGNNTPPVLIQATDPSGMFAIPTNGLTTKYETNNQTPSYVFQSDKDGIVAVSEGYAFGTLDASQVDIAADTDHTITFTTIVEGTHSSTNAEVAITVTDIHGNVSDPLYVPEFIIDITSPTVALATADSYAFKTHWNTATPQIKITSDVVGFLSIKNADGVIDDGITVPAKNGSGVRPIVAGTETPITFNAAEAAYATGDFKIVVTDLAGNTTDFDISAFHVDLTDPTVTADTLTVVSNNDDDAADANLAIEDDVVTLTFTASEELHATAANNTVVFKVGDGDAKTAVNLVATAAADDGHTYEASFTVEAGDNGLVSYVIKMTDLAVNEITNASADSNCTVDTTAPTVTADTLTVVSNNDDDADGSNLAIKDDVVTLTFTASEELHATADHNTVVFTVGDGDAKTAVNLVKTAAADDGHTYEASFTVADGDDGVVSYVIKMTDLAGNETTTASEDSNCTVDTTAPTIAVDGESAKILTVLSNNDDDADDANLAIKDDVVTLTFTASEELHGTADHNTVIFTVGDGAARTAVSLTATENDNEYTASMSAVVADENGVVSYVIKMTDLAGNETTTASADSNCLVDTTDPSVTADTLTVVSNNDDDADDVNLAIEDDVVTLTFTASEELHGTPDHNTVVFTVGDGDAKTAVDLVKTTAADDGHTYEASFTIEAGDNGLVSYVIKMTDLAGNEITNASADSNCTVDTTAPLIKEDGEGAEIITVLSNNDDDADGSNLAIKDDVVTLTFTASEELHGTPDHNTVVFTVGDGDAKTAVNLAHGAANGTDEYEASFTVAAGDNGVVSYVIKMTDLAGNETTTASEDSNCTVDTTDPTVTADTLTVVSNNDDDAADANLAIEDDVVTLTFTASEELHGTADHNTVVFTVGDGDAKTAVNLAKTAAADDGHTYEASFTVADGDDGVVSYVIKMTDLAGNEITNASADSNCTVDTTAPTVTADTLTVVSNNDDDADGSNLAIEDDVVTLTFTASEELHETADHNTVVFKVGDGDAKTAVDLVKTTAADDGHTYEASFTVADGDDGVVSYVIKMTDLAGNEITNASADSNCTVDTTAPLIKEDDEGAEIITVLSNNDDDADGSNLAIKDDVVTLTFTASEELHETADHNTVVFTVGDGDAKTAVNLVKTAAADDGHTYEASFTVADGDDGLVSYVIMMTDLAGNETTTASEDSNCTVDTTDPTVTADTLTVVSNNDDDAADANLAIEDDVVTLTFTASEELHATADHNTVVFTVGDGDARPAVNLIATENDNEYTASMSAVVADENGVVSYVIKMTDLAGNEITNASADSNCTVDTTAPTVTADTLTVVSNNDDDADDVNLAIEDDVVTLTFTASEELHGTADHNTVVFTVGDGDAKTAVDLVKTTADDDGHTYEASFTVADGDDGVVSYVIKMTDLAGNETTTASADSNCTVDTTAPSVKSGETVTVTATRGAGNDADNTITKAKAGDVIDISFLASEELHGTEDHNTVTFTIGTTEITAIDLSKAADSNTYSASHTVVVDGGEGVVKYIIKMTDLAGNETTTASADSSINVNYTAPTLTQVTAISTRGNDNTPSYVFTSNKQGSVTISSGTISSGDAIAAEGINANHTVTLGELADGTHSSLAVTDDEDNIVTAATTITLTVTDLHGNTSTLDIPEFEIDTTAPTVSAFAIVSNNPVTTQVDGIDVTTGSSTHAKIGNTITVTLTMSEACAANDPSIVFYTNDDLTTMVDGAQVSVSDESWTSHGGMTVTTTDNITFTGTITVTDAMGIFSKVIVNTAKDYATGQTMTEATKIYGASAMKILTAAPTISLDSATLTIKDDAGITLPTATVTDSAGTTLTPTLTYSNGVVATDDLLTGGETYIVYYNVTDSAQQVADQQTFTITVNYSDEDKPTLSIVDVDGVSQFISNNAEGTTVAKAGDVITFKVASDELLKEDPTIVLTVGGTEIVNAGNQHYTFTKTADDDTTDPATPINEWTVEYTLQGGDLTGAITATADGRDIATLPADQLTASGITFYKAITWSALNNNNYAQIHKEGTDFTAEAPTAADSNGNALNVTLLSGATGEKDGDGNDIAYGTPPDNQSPHDDSNVLTYTATDAAGNTSTQTFTVTTIDQTAPTITKAETTGDSTFKLTFSEAIGTVTDSAIQIAFDDDADSFSATTLTLPPEGSDAKIVAGTWTGKTFLLGFPYIVKVVDATIKDTQNVALATEESAATFTSDHPGDTTAPTITTVFAVNAANSEATITFSEAVYKADGSTALEKADLPLTIASGTATLTSYTLSTSDNKTFTFGLTLDGTPDGFEVLTLGSATTKVYDWYIKNELVLDVNVILNDLAPPTITTVFAVNADNSEATITFSEPVYKSDGSTALTVDELVLSVAANGGTAELADTDPYTVSTLDNKTFTFDLDLDGTIATGAEVLTLAGVTVYDAALNTLAVAETTITFNDKTPPTMTITSSTSGVTDGSSTKDTTIALTFTPSQAATGFAADDIVVTGGVLSGFAAVDDTNNYTATFTPTANSIGNVACTIDVAADVFTDANGNNNTAATTFNWTKLDHVAPTKTADLAISNDSNTEAIITFNEAVFASDAVTALAKGTDETPGFTLSIASGTATLTDYTVTPSNDNKTFTFGLTLNGLSDGAEVLTLAGHVYDVGSNTIEISESVTFKDLTAPSIATVLTVADDNASASITFSESVFASDGSTALTKDDLVLSISGGTAALDADYTVTASNDNKTFTFGSLTTGLADGSETLALAGTVYDTDAANDTVISPTAALNDLTPPTVTITSSTSGVADGDRTTDATIALTFTLSEAAKVDLTAASITVTNGSLDTFAKDDTDDKIYTATFTPTADGACTILVAAGVFTDAVDNANTVSSTFNWHFDTTSPTIAITAVDSSDAALASGSTTNDASITLTFEPNEDTGATFAAEDVIVSGGTLGGWAAVSETYNYTATLTPNGSATYTIDINAGKFTDEAGNSNIAAPQFTWIYDGTDPTIAITAVDSDDAALGSNQTTNDATITLKFAPNEVATGFAIEDVIVVATGLDNNDGSFGDLSIADENNTYTAVFTPGSDTTYTFSIDAGAFTDPVGNDNAASTDFKWTYDSTAPSYVSSLVANDPAGDAADENIVVITFDENIAANASIDPADFSVKVDDAAAAAPSSVAIDGGKVKLTLASAVKHGQVVTITYVKHATVGRNIADAQGNAVATFGTDTRKTVTNNVLDEDVPTFTSGATNTETVTENVGVSQHVYTAVATANDTSGPITHYTITSDDDGALFGFMQTDDTFGVNTDDCRRARQQLLRMITMILVKYTS